MKLSCPRSTITLCALFVAAASACAQSQAPNESDAVRVNMTMNADGSRTTYRFDPPNHKATAVTTEPDGKLRGKTRYVLDGAGRFVSSVSFTPDGKFHLKSTYKYDSAGRLEQETQLGKDDSVLNKIVYSYDGSGKQTGYSIFDGSGKIIGQTSTPAPTASPKSRAKK
jgi:hypothetical protein